MCDLSPKLPYCEKSRAPWSHRDQNVVSPGTGLNCEVPQREEAGAKRAQEREVESWGSGEMQSQGPRGIHKMYQAMYKKY